MNPELMLTIALLMGLAAALYSTVGHGGASAYIAIMALWRSAPCWVVTSVQGGWTSGAFFKR